MPHSLIRLYFNSCLLLLMVYASGAKAACVSGRVFDASGNPIENVDLDFVDAVTGVKLNTSGFDDTDVLGAYRVCFFPGAVYNISFDPPDSTHLIGEWLYAVDLSANPDTILEDIYLDFGVAISGKVTDTNGVPIGDVDIDVDSLSGGRVYTPNDNTKLTTGAYWIVVPPGDYRLRFDPPPTGGRLRGLQLDSVTITGDTVINVTLTEGVLLSGLVTDTAGQGLYDIDVDLRVDSTGERVFVSNNSTDDTGYYNVAIPTGTFDLRFSPPIGSRVVAELVDSFVISGDTVWNQVLREGVICSTFVHDSAGNPVAGVDLDFKQESTGIKVFTPNDNTNSEGYAVVSVFPDIYTMQLEPPLGTAFDHLIVNGVSIQSDTVFDYLLPEVVRVNFSGRVTDSLGQGLPAIEIDLRDTLTGRNAYVPNNLTDTGGFFNVAVPIGTYDVLFGPPKGSRYVGVSRDGFTFDQDTIWDAVILPSGLLFTAYVVDDLAQPVYNSDLDFISETTLKEVYTPHDNTDVNGLAQVAVLPDMYTIRVEPPIGSILSMLTVGGVSVLGDTTVTFILSQTTDIEIDSSDFQGEMRFVLEQNYPNPFNSETRIWYILPTAGEVSLSVYNVLGQLVRVLKSGFHSTGLHVAAWDATNQQGEAVASGIYFYRLETEQGFSTRPMVLIR